MLRGLRNFLSESRSEHLSTDHLKERSGERRWSKFYLLRSRTICVQADFVDPVSRVTLRGLPCSYQVITGASTSQAQVVFSVGAEKRVPPQNKLERKKLLFLFPSYFV